MTWTFEITAASKSEAKLKLADVRPPYASAVELAFFRKTREFLTAIVDEIPEEQDKKLLAQIFIEADGRNASVQQIRVKPLYVEADK